MVRYTDSILTNSAVKMPKVIFVIMIFQSTYIEYRSW